MSMAVSDFLIPSQCYFIYWSSLSWKHIFPRDGDLRSCMYCCIFRTQNTEYWIDVFWTKSSSFSWLSSTPNLSFISFSQTLPRPTCHTALTLGSVEKEELGSSLPCQVLTSKGSISILPLFSKDPLASSLLRQLPVTLFRFRFNTRQTPLQHLGDKGSWLTGPWADQSGKKPPHW